jgi:DNA mismatch repair ATPase MutS
VARLAGLPPAVLDIARQVLARLERYEFDVFAEEDQLVSQTVVEPLAAAHGAGANESATVTPATTALDVATRRAGRRKAAAQASLFDLANQKAIEEILSVDADKLSPDEAKELLRKLRARLM